MSNDWWLAASCSGMAPAQGNYDLFFEEEHLTQAKKICLTCPVRYDCLEYAIEERFVDGCWGGLSINKRKKIWRTMDKKDITMNEAITLLQLDVPIPINNHGEAEVRRVP